MFQPNTKTAPCLEQLEGGKGLLINKKIYTVIFNVLISIFS